MSIINFTYDNKDKKDSGQTHNIPASAIILEKTDRITARELENVKVPEKPTEDEKKEENK